GRRRLGPRSARGRARDRGSDVRQRLGPSIRAPVRLAARVSRDVRPRSRRDCVARPASGGGGSSGSDVILGFLRSRAGVALLLLMAVGAALRFATLGQQSYFYDESLTGALTGSSLAGGSPAL